MTCRKKNTNIHDKPDHRHFCFFFLNNPSKNHGIQIVRNIISNMRKTYKYDFINFKRRLFRIIKCSRLCSFLFKDPKFNCKLKYHSVCIRLNDFKNGEVKFFIISIHCTPFLCCFIIVFFFI